MVVDTKVRRAAPPFSKSAATTVLFLSFALIVFAGGFFVRLPDSNNLASRVKLREIEWGSLKKRLSSSKDVSLYDFLLTNEESDLLKGENVLKETLVALEHDSARAGVGVIFDLLSEVDAMWPKASFTDRGYKKAELLDSKLNELDRADVFAELEGLVASGDLVGDDVLKDFQEKINDSGAQFLATEKSIIEDAIASSRFKSFLTIASQIHDQLKKSPESKEIAKKALKHLEKCERFLDESPRANAMLRKLLLRDLDENPQGR